MKNARGWHCHHPREYPRPDGATVDTSCRCYLRGPDGVRRLKSSGTWDVGKYSVRVASVKHDDAPCRRAEPYASSALAMTSPARRQSAVDTSRCVTSRMRVVLHSEMSTP